MKKILISVLILFLVLVASPLYAQPTEEEMGEAFGLSFQAFFMVSFQAAFGMEIPGAEVSDTTMIFDDLAFSSLGIEAEELYSYETISGTIESIGDSKIVADVVLTGGPVRKLKWEIIDFDMEDSFDVNITADGRTLKINSGDFDD